MIGTTTRRGPGRIPPKRPSRALVAGLGALLALSGCAADIARSDPGAAPAVAYVYRLAPDDRVRVNVYNEAGVSGEFAVNSEGNVSIPLVGMIRAQGQTIGEFSDSLTKTLQTRYYKTAHVAVDLIAARPIYVLGEVNKAGQFPYQAGMTVLGAVATAGGFSYRANQKTVMIRHNGEAAEQRAPLTAELSVQPGDTVRIRERNF
ncbi:polysaccharide biosynthesis/export family protein [Sphingomonas sp. CARO-RG-8B-R24-01]|uniref:polysaccharide biosynthesis/export family protein n=1 Tax=Sphingomonas sp. CARO-RG-8B-R24-01 TaxID=2914831 RepID=UPI001F55F584|nr:polysaccharide biosynthesis/export family protein [Sphingomonas sp. CARO-RG-8B-R24-01]